MTLRELLCEELVCARLRAGARDEAIRELLGMLVNAGKLAEDRLEPVFSAIIGREALGSTAIGRGAAVPHARAPGVDQVLMALGLSRQGVEFNALDGEVVHSIFLVIGPETKAAEDYLSVMATISRLLHNDDFRRFLASARSSGEVLDLIEEMGG